MSKHTPGPWEVCETVYPSRTVYSVRNKDFGEPNPCPENPYLGMSWATEAEEDARLIAAAPSLLEALEAIVDGGNVHHGTCSKVDASDIEVARQAIKKARG